MTAWRKSSRSGSTSTQSDCVEVAGLTVGVGIRDGKDPDGGHLELDRAAFADLLARVKRDELAGR
ncbi:DUF397 domain-containing protein [Actinomadura sp. WMMB 499]|uniref:DUF397 domain-containing protein n=1 Tax=Actinomadura sp. WMMB 499 TaxID=1219491 RepID=UPI001243CD44|nr:DUF397 domain-containing protein [Actinomadura sp. WMMB 499]QFG24492.1 DUF397 domain-containing protein [Actinomadura sp. WMMB 499]